MSTLLIIFISAVILTAVFLGIQIRRIRKGDLAHDHTHGERFREALARTKADMLYSAKRIGHILILLVLKGWIKTTSAYTRLKKKIQKKLHPHVQQVLPENSSASQFLQNVGEYKQKLKRISDKIREDEEI